MPETPDVENTQTGPVVIKASNPTAAEMEKLCKSVQTNYNFKVDVKSIKFNFKKQKDKATGIETIREPVELPVAFPSFEGILAILDSDDKQRELLFDAMETVILGVARDIIAEDTSINASNFPVDKISWEAIANMPKAQRRGGGIPKEIWEAFAKDYVEIMPGITGKTIEQITNMSRIFTNRLSNVKTNKEVLGLVMTQLAIYAENSPNLDEYKECVEFLVNKADTFLNLSPEELMANL